jgi:hypothetical protein
MERVGVTTTADFQFALRTQCNQGQRTAALKDLSRQRRTCTKLVRFSPGELAAVTLRAAECRRPVACYIRETALGAALHARHNPVNDALIRELARLANQLVPLGHRAKELQLPGAPEFERALGVLLTTIRSIE